MKKNRDQLRVRREFIKDCFNDPDKAATYLEDHANRLRITDKYMEKITIIRDILFLSGETIYLDYLSDNDP